MAFVVSLPVYEDYDQFAVWPAEQSVSEIHFMTSLTETKYTQNFKLKLVVFS